MTQTISFRNRLKAGLARLGWQPVQLAAALVERDVDCTAQTVERWLEGRNEPRFATGERVLEILGEAASTSESTAEVN